MQVVGLTVVSLAAAEAHVVRLCPQPCMLMSKWRVWVDAATGRLRPTGPLTVLGHSASLLIPITTLTRRFDTRIILGYWTLLVYGNLYIGDIPKFIE